MWLSSVAFAGVWVHDPGAGYVQLSAVHQESSRVFLDTGAVVPQADPALLGHLSPLFDEGRYATGELSLYGELGIVRGIELVGSLPVRTVSNRWSFAQGSYPDIVQENAGLGDLSAGARVGVVREGWALSGLATVRLPLYDNAPAVLHVEAGNSDFEDDRVPLGAGTTDVDLGAGVGRGLGRGWALAEAGLRIRNRHFSTVLPARLQLGAKPVDRLAVWLGADAWLSLGDGSAPDAFRDRWGKGPVAIDNQSVLSASFGASVALGAGVGLLATVGRAVYAVRFPLLTTASVGVSWTFDARGTP